MSYHGYIGIVKQHLSNFQQPKILEIGVDRGVMMFPIVTHLGYNKDEFMYIGVDIMLQESVKLMKVMLDPPVPQSTYLIEDSSLNVLPQLAEKGLKFDVVLLDGDHNYHTVSQELKYLDAITHENSIVIIDDFDGKWSERDLWYAERPGYEENSRATKPVDTEKHGVKPAVNEWLQTNINWKVQKPVPGEPILLMK